MPARQQSASAGETTGDPNKFSDEVLSIRWSNPAFGVPGPSGGRSGSSRSAIAEGRQKEGVSMSVEVVSRHRVAAVLVNLKIRRESPLCFTLFMVSLRSS